MTSTQRVSLDIIEKFTKNQEYEEKFLSEENIGFPSTLPPKKQWVLHINHQPSSV